MTTPLVLGMDVGGTSSRALVADLDGRIVGRGSAGGGNPTAHGVAPAVAQIRAAIEQALAGIDGRTIDPNALCANVIGAAGFGGREAREGLAALWVDLGLPGDPVVTGDVNVAFASGSAASSGSVLIGGTGAVAASIEEGRDALLADGAGWLLGDHGSGFWVGREAVRASFAPGSDPGDSLAAAVADHLGVTLTGDLTGDRASLIQAAYARAPVRLSELAPVVVRLADSGSDRADGILMAAADELIRTLSEIRGEGATSPVVLGGGLLGTARLRSLVVDRIARTWPGAEVRHTGSGVGGAAWLAARASGRDLPPGLHALLTRPQD